MKNVYFFVMLKSMKNFIFYNRKNKKGFTIIEVVLVLAVTGLIFLMIFVALPALQRSQRDAQRKNDLAIIKASVINYKTNNGSFSNLSRIKGKLIKIGSKEDMLKGYLQEVSNETRYYKIVGSFDESNGAGSSGETLYVSKNYPEELYSTVMIGLGAECYLDNTVSDSAYRINTGSELKDRNNINKIVILSQLESLKLPELRGLFYEANYCFE